MAKFIVTSGSHFDPFSYAELASPVEQAAEAHYAAQDAYDTLESGAETLRQYILREPEDSEARIMYDAYMDKLSRLQNNLWERGYGAGTRRDLSAARAGYQSDITRLANAVKDRSERSAAYWDARHKNPNLVTSQDPGLGTLQDYLRDENYGLNWFSYDSAQFEKEVFNEMQSRAKGMLSGLTDENGVVKNPALKSQLTRIINKGAKPEEVDAAMGLVDGLIDMTPEQRDKYYKDHNTSAVVSMMTESLINRYDATGIRGHADIAPAERAKLLNRGKSGLVGLIGEPEVKDFSNPDYEFEMWKRKEAIQHEHAMELAGLKKGAGSGSGSGSGSGGSKEGSPYSIQTLASYMDTKEAKEITSFLNDRFVKKFQEPIPVVGLDGRADSITSAYDVQRILDDLGRKDFYRTYGVDPSEQVIGTRKVVDGDGKEHRITIASAHGGYAGNPKDFTVSYDGKPDPVMSKQFSDDYKAFMRRYDEWKARNKGVNLNDLKVKEKDWDKMAKDYEIPETVDRRYWPAIMEAKADIGYRTPSYLASYTNDMPEVRQNYAAAAYSAYTGAEKDSKGKVAKTSHVAVRKISPDGKTLGYELDMRDVLGIKGAKGSEYRNDTISEIRAFPEDIIANQIRFTTSTYDGEYAANPSIFGNAVRNVYNDLRKPIYEVYSDGSTEMLDNQGIVHYMMKPIVDPVSAFTMSEDQRKEWTRVTAGTLQDYMQFYSTDLNGNVTGMVTPLTIATQPEYREALRSAVSQYVDAALAAPRDVMNQNIMQKKSSSIANPGSMDLGLNP